MSDTGERRGVSGVPMAAAKDDDAEFTFEVAVSPVAEACAVAAAGEDEAGDEGPGDGELPCFDVEGLLPLPSAPAFVRESCVVSNIWESCERVLLPRLRLELHSALRYSRQPSSTPSFWRYLVLRASSSSQTSRTSSWSRITCCWCRVYGLLDAERAPVGNRNTCYDLMSKVDKKETLAETTSRSRVACELGRVLR